MRGYDREDTLFYLDPPYYGTEAYYRRVFSREDHCRLRELLGNIQGYFVLSYNDDPFIRKLYEGFQMIQVDRMNNLSENRKRYPELIIKNFDIL